MGEYCANAIAENDKGRICRFSKKPCVGDTYEKEARNTVYDNCAARKCPLYSDVPLTCESELCLMEREDKITGLEARLPETAVSLIEPPSF